MCSSDLFKLRRSAADLKQLAPRYGGSVDFRLVYIREAHTEGGGPIQWRARSTSKKDRPRIGAQGGGETGARGALPGGKLELPFAPTVGCMDAAAARLRRLAKRFAFFDGRVAFETQRAKSLSCSIRRSAGRRTTAQGPICPARR